MVTEQTNIPQHIAIIMDGNGRWATNKGLSRDKGHTEGRESAKEMVRTCAKIGVKNLTLFAFSSENWQRPKLEVELLMGLLHNSLMTELKELQKNNIRLKTIGDTSKLPIVVRKFLEKVCKQTKDNHEIQQSCCRECNFPNPV